jgi:hypothetical protein
LLNSLFGTCGGTLTTVREMQFALRDSSRQDFNYDSGAFMPRIPFSRHPSREPINKWKALARVSESESNEVSLLN